MFLNNFELLLLSCNQIDIEVVISIKNGWSTICLGKNYTSGTLTIPAVKSQNFADFTGTRKST